MTDPRPESPPAEPPVVLVVEDEAPNRALLRAVLSRSGDPSLQAAVVVEAASLAEAHRVLATRRVDLVLLDVRLPDGNGLDLATALQEQPTGSRPRIVILSASVLPHDRDAALQSGVDAFLGKPYRPAELVTTLRHVLDWNPPDPGQE